MAAALLSAGTGRAAARFVCRLGDDAYLGWLQGELARAGLDTSASVVVPGMSTGAGIVWWVARWGRGQCGGPLRGWVGSPVVASAACPASGVVIAEI